jgi:hypothetical protein
MSLPSSPTSSLHDLVLDLDWAQVERHALHCPLDAQYRSSESNETPLFLALEIGFPPLSTVKALLRAYPEAAILPQTKNRYLPIHLACRFGRLTIKYATIKELLFINSEDNEGILLQPQYLPSVHANVRSRYGETPLSALADSFRSWYQDFDTTEATELASIRVVQEHWQCVHLVLQAACGHLDSNFNRKALSGGDDNSIYLDSSPPAFLPVHSALQLGVTHDCPYHIVVLAIEMCPVHHFTTPDPPRHSSFFHDGPQQVQHTKDNLCTGRLPIHIAITNAKSAFKSETNYHSILCAIIDKCPLAASIPDPLTKSYPLHLALSSSWFIHCPKTCSSTFALGSTSIGSSSINEILPWEPILRKLCMAYPNAMEQLDLYTKLYPFAMVALQGALARDQRNTTEESHDSHCNAHVTDVTILTAIYELLLMKPHVLGNYC